MLIGGLSLLLAAVVAIVVRDLLLARAVPILQPVTSRQCERVSVLIPARDEAARLGRLLDGLSHQIGVDFEVIVLDDHSRDGTAALAQSWCNRIPDLQVRPGEPLPG